MDDTMGALTTFRDWYTDTYGHLHGLPFGLFICLSAVILFTVAALLYLLLFIVAPIPRGPYRNEKTYRTVLPDGRTSEEKQLPCWLDTWRARRTEASRKDLPDLATEDIEPAEVFVSVVVPSYNEEERLGGMLEEAVDYLQKQYGDAHGTFAETASVAGKPSGNKNKKTVNGSAHTLTNSTPKGWEILVVSDGSKDKTEEVALGFAKKHQLAHHPHKVKGPWKNTGHDTRIPYGSIRVITLEENRGKGGAVTHGMRHVRGAYAVFADADGASKFEDLGHLITGCQAVQDKQARGVAIGSRAHLVGSDAVVKQRSKLRNFLMHSFHLFIRLLTTRKTSKIKDTQCGFKLFSRASLPYIIPYMHSEGWIFDVEMLMLAESANIPMIEVPIGWKEVAGSKLNVVKDSVAMAWGLAVLRVSWVLGVYSRS
ncbi:hypothetical protein EJ05DRAFT_460293 [Pseudovirgaria hyperparasitica]|uniref:dolichyl-phosphate beta-glucosyltransferase n=1 Tax=Pseudovirgaria hyperparasitica TaxID=470096 RepID=A0A6A6WMT1_9PEZI|nr:uncharacterized protein EJ05DRAFT_460293 [Pseudovirgaria hyperparasitica]KAF2763525.1 hypothetical protein EJ05DRAFT_460293 [Pseudovirgaria hyperparasitica]